MFYPRVVLALTLNEDFNDGNTDGWVVGDEPGRNQCSAPWVVENGELLIEISQQSCTTHLVPTDELWNNLGDEYQIDVDMRSGGGTDHNIAFRLTLLPPDTNNWYGYHFIYPDNIVLERVPAGNTSNSVTYSLTHNRTYHLTIMVRTGNIQLLIDDQMVLNYSYDPIQDRFPTGKFAFRVGTGNDSYSKTYFDNLVVQSLNEPSPSPSQSPSPSPSPSPNTPIVFLPGMGGSWNTAELISGNSGGIWKKTPFIKVYDNLKNTFLNTGYSEGDDYFEFYYDWRRPVENSADKLNEFINSVVLAGKDPGTKINLVGHSLGGIVSRAYGQKYGEDKLNQLVTTGSPHQGAILPYLLWSGAQINDHLGWDWLGFQLLLHLHQGRFASPVSAVRSLGPSLENLLPVFDFAKNSSNEILPIGSMETVNDYLNQLANDLTAGLTDLITTIAGNQTETIEWIKLEDRTVADRLLDRWQDGRPAGYEYTNAGDATVLSRSALLQDTDQLEIAGSHQDLVQTTTGIESILSALGIDAEPQTGNEQPTRNPGLFFLLHSPAEITVTAPDGSQAGFNVASPMPNAFYSPEDKLLLIYSAAAGNYQTEITGTDDGKYQLDIGQLTDQGEFFSSLLDEINLGGTDDWTINFNPTQPLTDPVIDESGESKIAQARLRLQQLKLRTKPKLTVYLNQILKLLDKNRLAQLRLALSSTYKFRYWVDKFAQSDTGFKSEADQIGQLLSQALVISGKNSQALSKKQVQAELNAAAKAKQQLETKIGQISGENHNLGNALELINRYFDRAQTSFNQNNFWQTHADALVVRVLAIEAQALIR